MDDAFFICSLCCIIWHNFCGGGDSSHSRSIFKIHKRINIGTTGSSNRDSCCELLKNLVFLPCHPQYIFSLLLFVVKSRELFRSNSDVHNMNTRSHSDFTCTCSKFVVFQKAVFNFGIRVINKLLSSIKHLSNDMKQFILALEGFFLLPPFIVWTNILEVN